MLLTPVNF